VLASNGGVGWRWQAGRLGFGTQDTTAAFGAAPLRVPERPNLGHLHYRTRRLKNSRSAFWSHVVLAVLANLSASGPKRHSLRHGVTSQGQAAKASKGRAERSVADFPHPEAVQGSNNAQRPATKLHSRLFGATLWTPPSDRSCMAVRRHLWCSVLVGIVPEVQGR
jgi:hypothetical protein